MVDLIKMDLRRLFHTPMFIVTMLVIAFLNIMMSFGFTWIGRILTPDLGAGEVEITEVISTPFAGSLFAIGMFASLISFSYADIANGFVKNLAGQVEHRSYIIYSKFIVLGVHNFLFLTAGVLSNLLGNVLCSALGYQVLTNNGKIPAAIITVLLKWMLCMAISAILVFLTNGVRNKTLATIIGVVIGSGSLGLAYMGLSMAINNMLKTSDFDVAEYMPDTLMRSVNVAANTAVVNALIVSIVCTAIFLTITVKVFKTRDVK